MLRHGAEAQVGWKGGRHGHAGGGDTAERLQGARAEGGPAVFKAFGRYASAIESFVFRPNKKIYAPRVAAAHEPRDNVRLADDGTGSGAGGGGGGEDAHAVARGLRIETSKGKTI